MDELKSLCATFASFGLGVICGLSFFVVIIIVCLVHVITRFL